MDTWQVLNGRVSCPKVTAVAPSQMQIDRLLRAAVSAPDHGKLRPWRFLVLQGDDRARLGEMFVAAAKQNTPDLNESACDKLRTKPLRAPVVIVVVAEVVEQHRIPVIEQVMSTVCAVEHMMLAGFAMGLGMMWRTGELAHDAFVKKSLGFAAKDEIVAFLYVGMPEAELQPRIAAPLQDYVRKLP
jgi:nitroreductase